MTSKKRTIATLYHGRISAVDNHAYFLKVDGKFYQTEQSRSDIYFLLTGNDVPYIQRSLREAFKAQVIRIGMNCELPCTPVLPMFKGYTFAYINNQVD